jgi:hypothetical protein
VSRRYPPAPYGWDLLCLRSNGKHKQARRLLASLNATQRAFGLPDYDMPEPYAGLQSVGLTEVHGDPFLNSRKEAA